MLNTPQVRGVNVLIRIDNLFLYWRNKVNDVFLLCLDYNFIQIISRSLIYHPIVGHCSPNHWEILASKQSHDEFVATLMLCGTLLLQCWWEASTDSKSELETPDPGNKMVLKMSSDVCWKESVIKELTLYRSPCSNNMLVSASLTPR